MSFDSRFYQQAENELNERRLRNERVLAAHESEISKNSPDIIAVQRELAATGTKVIELILNKDKDFSESPIKQIHYQGYYHGSDFSIVLRVFLCHKSNI